MGKRCQSAYKSIKIELVCPFFPQGTIPRSPYRGGLGYAPNVLKSDMPPVRTYYLI